MARQQVQVMPQQQLGRVLREAGPAQPWGALLFNSLKLVPCVLLHLRAAAVEALVGMLSCAKTLSVS
jgi:hypothetical protein